MGLPQSPLEMLASRVSLESCHSWRPRSIPSRNAALKAPSKRPKATSFRPHQSLPSIGLSLTQSRQKRYHHQSSTRWSPLYSYSGVEAHREASKRTIHLDDLFAGLSGIAGAGALSAAAIQMDQPAKEEKLELPADPWLLTNTEPKTEPEAPLNNLGKFLNFIWDAFKLVTGITLVKYLARAIITTLGRIKHSLIPALADIFIGIAIQNSPMGQPVDAQKLVIDLAKVISSYNSASPARPGEIEALSKEIIDALLQSKAAPLLASHLERSLPLGQKHWAEAYTSAITNEELFLGVNYASFLAKSRRDGAVYHIEGYFALTSDSVPVPLLIYSKKAAHSQSELMQGKITDDWRTHLNQRWKRIGFGADAERDLSTEFRATFMPSDLRRLVSDEDWLSYLGAPFSDAKFTREKSSTAGVDLWKIAAKSDGKSSTDPKFATLNLRSVDVRIFSEPKSALSNVEVTFPETTDSLEDRVTLQSPVIMSARWCTYVEKHPVLAGIVGKDVRLVSAPLVQAFAAPKADFDGSMFDCKFDAAGSKGAVTLHFKVARDTIGDGRGALAPVISVWAETPHGRLEIYKNTRARYAIVQERAVSIPISTGPDSSPYLSSDLSIGSRDIAP